MAKIIAGIGTSHIPAIGVAIDFGKSGEAYWQPFFKGTGVKSGSEGVLTVSAKETTWGGLASLTELRSNSLDAWR